MVREEQAAMGIRRSNHCSCMGSRRSRPEAHTSLSNSPLTVSGPAGLVWASVPDSWAPGSVLLSALLSARLSAPALGSARSHRYGRISSQSRSQSNRLPS